MIETIIAQNKAFLESVATNREKYFSSSVAFTRKRKLGAKDIATIIINLPRKSMSVEIEDCLERMGKCDMDYTKSAFSHARLKLKSEFFQDLYVHQNRCFYQHADYQTWNDFRLIAIDGSTACIAETDALIAEFGTHKNQHGKYPMARYLIGQDILNHVCCFADIAPILTSETAMLFPWLDQMQTDMLCIYDRLFVSALLCYLHHVKSIPFLMRCKLSHNQIVKDFVARQATNEIVTFPLPHQAITELTKMGYAVSKGDGVPVRLIKVILDSGETEILATSLLDSDLYPTELFKGLYAKRWGAETTIGCLKNQLQIEIASGETPMAVKQDFYASIFTYNLQSMFIHSVKEQVEQINEKRVKNYQVNRNISLGLMKGRMVSLFASNDAQQVVTIIKFLQRKIIANLTECKRGQGINKPRIKRARKINGKYRPVTNYKRAL